MLILKELLNEKIKNKPKAPRAKKLHDAMMGRKSGAHYDAKRDYVRAKEKQKIRSELKESRRPVMAVQVDADLANELIDVVQFYKEQQGGVSHALDTVLDTLLHHFGDITGYTYEPPSTDKF